MSDPVQVSAVVEAALVAAITAKLPTGNGAQVQGWWQSGDDPNVAKSVSAPAILVSASPDVPNGYRSLLRKVPVQINCLTNPGDDLNGADIRALYMAAREVLDTNTLAMAEGSGVVYRGHEILDPGPPGMDERGWYINLSAVYEVTLTP